MMKILAVGVFASLGMLMGQNAMASDWWSTFALKEWMTTYTPGNGLPNAKGNASILTLNVGYQKVFATMSILPSTSYSGPGYPGFGPNGRIDHFGQSGGLGYLLTPEVFLAVVKRGEYTNTLFSGSSNTDQRMNYTSLGLAINHSIENSNFSINGNVAYGKGSATTKGAITIVGSNKGSYLAYEFGGGYSFSKTVKANLSYRVEQFDNIFPTATLGQASLYKTNISGLLAGIVFSF